MLRLAEQANLPFRNHSPTSRYYSANISIAMGTLVELILVVACLLVPQLTAGKALSFKDASLSCHRLPLNVRPTKYDLHLKFPSLDSGVYEGHVDIAVEFVKSNAKMLAAWGLDGASCAQHYDENTIVLHADKSLEIHDIEVSSEPCFKIICGAEQKQREIVELTRDEAKQMIAIKLKSGTRASRSGIAGKISISFKGKMRDDKRGVYLSTYNDGQQVYKHIVSQFQPTDARTVFPSFDEPRFRVPFSVRLTYPKGLTAYGNTEIQKRFDESELTSILFATTPNMPVHMVAFTIGHFDQPLEAISTRVFPNQKDKVRKIRVITAPGKRHTADFALQVAFESLTWFERYIEYDFPLDKLDIIAIADHDKDNTENWGLVFIRDTLIWIDDETKTDTQITTAVNVAHVVVHQWFGNLISASWWSDLWITEGVAAQFAFSIVQKLYLYQTEYFVRLATLSGVLQADQAGKLHPLSPSEGNLRTSEQIYSIFDQLEFTKSAAMAQMVEESVGGEEYQKILRELIKERAHKTVNFEDYQRAILAANTKLRLPDFDRFLDLIKSFPKYTGVPVVNCFIDMDWPDREIRLDVESFTGARRNIYGIHDFQIDVSIKVSAVIGIGTSNYPTKLKFLSATDTGLRNAIKLPGGFDLYTPTSREYIKIDREPSIATYYRTRYSDLFYKLLETAIKEKFISPMNRLQILDDANSLVQANLIRPSQFKSLLNSYADEDYPAVVIAILSATNTYSTLKPGDVSSLQSNKAISAIYEKYGFGVNETEELIMQRARQVVLTNLIKQGNQRVLATALEAFDKADGKVALFLREPVYTAVVLSGSDRVSKLLSHLSETRSYEEQIRLVTALTLSKDKEVLTRVKSWLESSGLKAETTKPFLNAISAALSQ